MNQEYDELTSALLIYAMAYYFLAVELAKGFSGW